MRYPIILFAFDRLDYFEALLQSLTRQVGAGLADREVHLFQDGSVCAWTREPRTTREAVDRSVALFRAHVPHGTVHFDDVNRGIAFQWRLAEEFIFGRCGAAAAYMLEDDTILGPHYLAMTDRLAERALAHGRISYISAFGDPLASLEQQRENRRGMQPMNHTWAAVMLRDYWLKERELLRPYYELMARQPYGLRPHDAILQLLHKTMGCGRGTAQDSAKESASIALGCARLTTRVCQAKYIGDRGAHFTRAIYEQYGFDRATLFPEPVFDVDLPDDGAVDRIVASERALVQRHMFRQALCHPGLFAALAKPVRVAVDGGLWLVAGEPGLPVAATADAQRASVLSVMAWSDEPGTIVAIRDAQGRFCGLDETHTLSVRPAGPELVYFLHAGTAERFYLQTHDGRALAYRADPGGGGCLQAIARTYPEAAAFTLHPA